MRICGFAIYAIAFDMCYHTRYAHYVSADLYHIEFERSENISNLSSHCERNISSRAKRGISTKQNGFCIHKRKIRHTSFEIYRIYENCPLERRYNAKLFL